MKKIPPEVRKLPTAHSIKPGLNPTHKWLNIKTFEVISEPNLSVVAQATAVKYDECQVKIHLK